MSCDLRLNVYKERIATKTKPAVLTGLKHTEIIHTNNTTKMEQGSGSIQDKS